MRPLSVDGAGTPGRLRRRLPHMLVRIAGSVGRRRALVRFAVLVARLSQNGAMTTPTEPGPTCAPIAAPAR